MGEIGVLEGEFEGRECLGRGWGEKRMEKYLFVKGVDGVGEGGMVGLMRWEGVLNRRKRWVGKEVLSEGNVVWGIGVGKKVLREKGGREVGSEVIVVEKKVRKKEMWEEEGVMRVIERERKRGVREKGYLMEEGEGMVDRMGKVEREG